MAGKKIVWRVVFSDGSESKFRSAAAFASAAEELAARKGLTAKKVVPVLYPRNPYARVFRRP